MGEEGMCMHYEVISNFEVVKFNADVEAKLADGWQLYGDPFGTQFQEVRNDGTAAGELYSMLNQAVVKWGPKK